MQTFYGILALGLLGLLTLVHQRHSTRAEARRMESEVETVALGLPAGRLNRAAVLPFDGAGKVDSPDDLTPAAAFGGARRAPPLTSTTSIAPSRR